MTRDLLAGPFPTGRELCDYSKTEGYATTTAPEGTAPSRARQLREEAIGR
jgi:hypothetical protein